tara:strand:- start:115 stop:453 length:339 start_codon:yes stop_codon:yes gene_type:complete
MENLNTEIIKKFWNHVKKTEDCWLWTSKTNSKSKYGLFRFRIKEKRFEFLAHRVSMFLEGKQQERIYHYCKNSLCVNPTHLAPHIQNQPHIEEVKQPVEKTIIKQEKHIVKW